LVECREAAAEVERLQILELEQLRRLQEEKMRELARLAQVAFSIPRE
jgi:hypothetical protein